MLASQITKSAPDQSSVAEILSSIPHTLIWDTSELISNFCKATAPMQWDSTAVGQIINEVIEYMCDGSSAHDGIAEVAEQRLMDYSKYAMGVLPESLTAEAIAQNVKDFGMALHSSLVKLNAYRFRNFLMYRFSGFVNDNDVVLVRLSYEELAFLDTPQLEAAG